MTLGKRFTVFDHLSVATVIELHGCPWALTPHRTFWPTWMALVEIPIQTCCRHVIAPAPCSAEAGAAVEMKQIETVGQ